MIWTDRGTKLKIKYYDIPDKYSYQAISSGIKKFKDEMDQLAFESGVYISLNVVVVKNAKRLILGLMYVNESVVDGVIDEMNALVERMKHDLKECEEVIPSAADNDFNRLIGCLNHTASDSDTKILDLGAMKKDEGRMFTGLLMHCDKDISPRELFVLNLLRGSIGDNDTDSTFFEIRKRGDIYSGFSKVFSETGTLLAGCFANYTQEISDEVKERIKLSINI